MQGRPGAGRVSVGQQAGNLAHLLSEPLLGVSGTCLSPQDQHQEWCFLPPYSFCFSHYTVAETVLQGLDLALDLGWCNAGSANSRPYLPSISCQTLPGLSGRSSWS